MARWTLPTFLLRDGTFEATFSVTELAMSFFWGLVENFYVSDTYMMITTLSSSLSHDLLFDVLNYRKTTNFP